MSQELIARFRIVTPMFLGGANQDPSDGIRPPSVKGALRFWWRALNWGRFRGQPGADDASALQALHKEEARLFGIAAGEDGGGGQGCFHLRVSEKITHAALPHARDGHKYMLGQGLIDPHGTYLRKAISGGTFTVNLRFRPKTTDPEQREIVNALLAWGLLGGLGSRSRRGLGSVAIESIDGDGITSIPPIPASLDKYGESLKELGLPMACGLPPYSAFSAHTRIDSSVSGTNAWSLLNDVGLEMMRYRGWGFDAGDGIHKVAGKKAEQNFPGDHDEMLRAVKGTAPTLLPCRAVFGLPHNYFFKSEFDGLTAQREAVLMNGYDPLPQAEARKKAKGWAGARSKAELAPATTHQTRRASPILVHSHSFNGQATIIQTLLPAVFLPPCEQIRVEAKRLPGGQSLVPARAEWNVIHTYLDRFVGRTALLTGRAVP